MKILIVGGENTDLYTVARELQAMDDDLAVAPVFSTDTALAGKVTGGFVYYMPAEEAELSYKNNAFMWVRADDMQSRGVTKPDMYSCSIFTMSFADFNNMSGTVLAELIADGCVVCFIDSRDNTERDITESGFACERIFSMPYLYFLDDSTDTITATVIEYMAADDSTRKKIAKENNC